MPKHSSFILVLFVLMKIQSLAQSATDSSFSEIGLNATAFVNQYLDFGSGNGEFVSPYIITYERRFGKMGVRIGLGMDGDRSEAKPENGDPNQPSLFTSSFESNVRTGVVFYKNISRRWDLKYGADVIFGMNKNKSWTEVNNLFGEPVKNTTTFRSAQIGLTPFVFIQFHLSEKFSLGTEMLFNVIGSEDVTKQESTEFPEFNSRQETTRLSYNTTPPIALFFIFRY